MNSSWIRQTGAGVALTIQLAPRAAQDAVQGLYGDALKIRLRAPPVAGRANAALLDFLSDKLGLPKGNIIFKSGLSQRRKIVAVNGLPAPEIEKKMLNLN